MCACVTSCVWVSKFLRFVVFACVSSSVFVFVFLSVLCVVVVLLGG